MKTSIILFVVACGIVAGGIVYLNHRKAPATPAPVAASSTSETAQAAPETQPVQTSEAAPVRAVPAAASAPAAVAAAAPVDAKTNDTANAISKTVDALLSARGDKSNMLDQLRKSGQLDDVIAELQRRAAANPTDSGIPTTLGEALLNKVRGMHDADPNNYNEMGILAMQADQQFNAALKIDPQNWEANFVKSVSMTYWPADPARDAEVVQRLSSLIDQQEKMSQIPEFAQTYIYLGNEYQKIGKQDEAAATWALGAQKFPGDPALQQKIAGGK